MANPSPPVGPALSQQSVSIMEFCEAFNAKVGSAEKGLSILVAITACADRSLTFIAKAPPTTVLLKKAASIKSGSDKPDKSEVGKISHAQLQEIAQIKTADMASSDIEVMTRSIEGTARSMGLVAEDQEMARLIKHTRVTHDKVDAIKQYDINGAIALLKELATAKFVESVDAAISLGINARKSDQNVRSATILPHGTSHSVHVAVFAQGTNTEAAKTVGAELIGMENPADQIKRDEINLDVVITPPDAMHVVGQLGQVLGPHGLTPNPRVGTVTPSVAEAVKNVKAGQVRYRNDKDGITHTIIGRVDFSADKLKENLEPLLVTLEKVKLTQAKGVYIKKASIPATMGASVAVDQSGLTTTMVN